jgi:membrane peptidoglycan carboxypeptidase
VSGQEGAPPPREDMADSGSGVTDDARRRLWRRGIAFLLFVLVALGAWHESRTSQLQSRIFARYASRLSYHFEPGPTDSVAYPVGGPFDLRRGYAFIPQVAETLAARNFAVTGQARMSPDLLWLTRHGVYAVYPTDARAGLEILDREDRPLYVLRFPERTYSSFDSIPSVVVSTLLFIENRELLDARFPYRNPAVEWDRLAKAAFDLALNAVGIDRPQAGGSTLATQMEKYRHASEGRTSSPVDKLKQMAAASLRAYARGRNTTQARRDIVRDYVNSVPLAAIAGYGEVRGLGDGLWAWFDTDLAEATRALRAVDSGAADIGPGAEAFKKVLALFIAHRRPTYYLVSNRAALSADTDRYLRLLGESGVIPPEFRDAALRAPLKFRQGPPVRTRPSYIERKATNAIRARLLRLMGVDQLYTLDRFDLTVESTLDGPTQKRVTQILGRLKEPAFADSLGLREFRLLSSGDPGGVIYSFTLFESTPDGNLLRVQADNLDQPLDINEGAKLDLGSTAKLRTLVHYLEIVADLQASNAGRPVADLRKAANQAKDSLRRWAFAVLASAADTTLPATLDAAMNRAYSADPDEKFFTGGGVHTFVNFKAEDNDKVLTVREGLRNSVNLVFIRLMRDIVRTYVAEAPGYADGLLEDVNHPLRRGYLERFADKEGQTFLSEFYKRYRHETPAERMEKLIDRIRPTPKRLAVIYRSVRPDAGPDSLAVFLKAHPAGYAITDRLVRDLYDSYGIEKFNLADRGYLAGVHPLELWLLNYLESRPDATWHDAVAASAKERQEVYAWLFKPSKREGQDKRIREILEEDAFKKIHAAWQRLGYPFDSLVPSYATAIGSSADRPAALADLMGIIVNDGVQMPAVRMTRLHFAQGMPYEVIFDARKPVPQRVLPAEVARVVRAGVIDVVENGTARRGYQAFKRADGSAIPLGGKTGTGDHRYETYAPGGRLLESRVVNRTATFVFLIGDRFFGTISCHVPGPEAARYVFTSSLPVQLVKSLAPALTPLVDRAPAADGAWPPASAASSKGTEAAYPPAAGDSTSANPGT